MISSFVRARRLILATGVASLLTAGHSSHAQSRFWDPAGDGNSAIGGTGVWNTTNLFWDPTGTDVLADNIAWPNDALSIAVFGGPGGTVTLNNAGATMTANGLTFSTAGYTLNSNVAGDTLTLAGTTPTISTAAGVVARINSVLAGTVGFTAAGPGELVLSGANTVSGPINIGAGTLLSSNNAAALGAGGVGNETIIAAGGSFNPGANLYGTEIFTIAGSGVGGAGAIVSQAPGNATNAASFTKVNLSANATVSAGGNLPAGFTANGVVSGGGLGRLDFRNSAAPTAGSATLNLAGNTLTKTGNALLAIVNHDVSNGDIVIDQGTISIEAGTLVQGTGTITVNPNGKLAFWGVTAAANISRPISVNGGTIGDVLSSASQTVNSPITMIGSQNPNWVGTTNTTTLAGLISEGAGSAITEFSKRGGGTLALSNAGNTFAAPITIYAGSLQGNYAAFTGGVAPAAPTALAGTPLGSAPVITLKGGTLNIRVDGANDTTNQVFTIGKSLVVDLAPGGINLDRVSAGSDKNLAIDVTFAPASAANGYSIGQNQLTGTQGNGYRTQLTSVTMNDDTVLNVGDFTVTGDVLTAKKNSLIHVGGNSWGFVGGTNHQFGALFNLGAAQLRIGSMFGTGITSNTVTAGTGTIYNAPNASLSFRTPTNLAAGQVFELVSQRVAQSTVNLEAGFTSIPTNLRATGAGVLGIGNATFSNVDVSKIGDGTFRIGANFSATGNGTITGSVAPGSGNTVRLGAAGTVTLSGTNAVTGGARLEVGSDLINGGFRTSGTGGAQNGTVILTGANDYTGGTVVNRASVLEFRNTLGSGGIFIGGTATASSVGNAGPHGTFIGAGPATIVGGATIRFVNDAITVDTTATPDRWDNATPLILTASTVEMRSRNIPTITSTTTEDVGPMTVSGGSFVSLQRLQAINGHVNELRANSLARLNQGTLELTRNTGTGAGYSDGNRFTLDSAPTVANGMVAPWIVGANNGPTEFMDYVATGFVPTTMNATVITGTYVAGALNYDGVAGTGGKVFVDTVDLTLQDNPVLYALRSQRTIINNGANNTVTLRSGGMILRNITDNTTITINPAVVANDGTANIELAVHTAGGGTGRNYTLAGAITANGLTKFGGGNLIIGTANPNLTGNVAVNAGTLQLVGPAVAGTHNPAGTGQIILGGGQLNLRSNATTAIAYTLQNQGITMVQNLPLATVDVNRGDASSTNLEIAINPATAAQPGLVLNGSAGAQGQTFRLIGGNGYSLRFGSNALNTFAGNVTLHTESANLALNNNPNITGTNPILTKSGGNMLDIGVNGGTPTIAAGTQVHMNDGTLQIRSLNTFGAAGEATLVLNRGTLNTRRDGDSLFGNAAAYPVFVNGSVTISTDRSGTTSTNGIHRLGKLTIANGVNLTHNSANGFALAFNGAQLNGNAFFTANAGAGSVDSALRFLSGFDVSGGTLIKGGGGHLHLLNPNSTYSGGTYINQGTLRARAAGALGTGPVFVNPGATLDLNANNNIGATQRLVVNSNSAYMAMLSVNTDGTLHPVGANVDVTGAPRGIVALSNGPAGVYNTPINLGSLYGGEWSLGGVSAGAYDPRYTASTLGVGAGNVYRLGGGGTSMGIGHDAAGAAHTNLLTGPNLVRLGFDSGNIRPANATNFQYAIAGINDYSGGATVIHRGMVARIFAAPDLVNNRTGLSNSAVDLYGVLGLSGSASLVNSTNTGNINLINLHPGAAIFLDNQNGGVGSAAAFAAANIANRFHDGTAIALNSSLINLTGQNDAASSEVIGDVTFAGGARLRVARGGTTTGTATLTLNSLTRAGNGSALMLQTGAVNQLGGVDKVIVTGGVPTSNGMASRFIVNATDNTFVNYVDNTTGFTNVTYDTPVTASPIPAGLAANQKVNVTAGGAVTLADNAVISVLRTERDINVAGPFSTLTLRGGGLIASNNALTIQPNLVFNDGTSNIEAAIYNSVTLNVNGTITAAGVTKFGTGALVLNVPQNATGGAWVVNSGTLQVADPRGLGSQPVTLNPVVSTGGQTGQNFTQTTLNFSRDMGTAELVTFSGGPITAINEATIVVGPGVDNRFTQVPNIIADSTGAGSGVGLTLQLPNARTRSTVPTLTLNDDTVLRVWDTGADLGRVSAVAVNSLIGANVDLEKLGNRTLELPNDNSATFTNGKITVSQGTIRVRHNGSLGGASVTTTIERNAALEIGVSNFTPAGAITQVAGSVERWNVEDARGTGNYSVPAGVNLQLNTNLIAATPRTITMNGGSLEGFLYTDHVAPADQRLVGSAVTLNLAVDSSVGQNINQGFGYDTGRGPTVGQPFGDNITGAQLRIEGQITGAGNLTKTGLDTVTIASTGNTYGDTIVEMGTLRTAAANALPATKTLSTRSGGVFDLYGNDQSVGGLGTLTGGSAVGTSVGASGTITNSGVTDNTLTVTGSSNTTYNGVIERNVALSKSGTGTLILGGSNTYVGMTTISAGSLLVTGSITGSAAVNVQTGGLLGGTGTVGGPATIAGTIAPGMNAGTLTMTGPADFDTGSIFALEILGPTSFDKLVANGVTLDGTVNLTIALGGYTPGAGLQFLVLDNVSGAAIGGNTGVFNFGGTPLAEGANFFVGTQEFDITYAGGSGNDVVLTAVPEPASVACLLLGGIGLLHLRRRRTKE